MTSLWAAVGLCLLKLCLAETQFNVSCRYGGVFHVEKNGRYSLTRSEAVELCRALNSTLATLEQLKRAHELGFETCRYGFVVGNIVIPRINPYHLCAANHTGIYKLSANTTGRYDAYCYNETETRDKTCEPIERLDTSLLSNQGEIVIDNADGSRYNPDGTRHSGESSTSGADDENVGSGSTHDTTPMDTSVRRSSPSYYGSATPVSQLPDHSSGGGEKDIPREDLDDETSPVSPDIPLVTAVDNSPTKDDGQYPASTTDVTSSGNGSDDEDSSEETIYPTVFPDWDRSVAKDEYAPSTTPRPHHDNLEKATTQAWWNPFSNHWWWSNPGEKTQEPVQATKDVTSSGNGSDDEDSSEETIYPTVFPDWDRSVAKDEYAPSTTTDSQHEILLEVSTQNHWNPAYTDEEEQYPSSAGRALVTSENENRQGPTPHPLLHSVHYGWISQEHNPANSTGSTEQHEFTVGGENDIEKESSHTAAASPGGAHHEDPTQPPLPSDSEPGQGTEGITHPRGTPGNEVLDRTSASTNEAGDDSPLMVAESVDDVNQEKATKEPLAPTTPSGSESEQVNTTDGSDVNWIPGVFPGIEDHLNQLQTPLPTRSTSSIDGNQGPHKGHHESTTFPGETTTTTIVSQPRSAQVPEWLIIVAALVALALILAVCIAVNSRRRCGQKKKLVINNGKGAVEDRKTSGLNGDASKSQEMVHLVHKEPSNDQTGACDEFLTINETQNHQELDMKSGV
ncbi:PREDICTED: CD44 antigen isoform X2 [Calidris pugnax]|uniref:CD44 antigen isoform X2 n=1 Tax=Calidris pugnax TaxID=198806 RepID=UPI00071E6406|nr:PREDICTED: CD44 antigen isoform X2 [Calidris pugnax]